MTRTQVSTPLTSTQVLRSLMDQASKYIQDLQRENHQLYQTVGDLRVRLAAYENPETGEPHGYISGYK